MLGWRNGGDYSPGRWRRNAIYTPSRCVEGDSSAVGEISLMGNRAAVPSRQDTNMMASKAWKVVQPHVPMIKFRKGGINRTVAGTIAAPSTRSGPASSAGAATGPGVIALPTIEDIHLPPRYRRRPIDQQEIEYINRGGPE